MTIKELIEQEILRQGYTILRWTETLKDGWGIEVVKEGRYTTFFVDEIVGEILERELQQPSFSPGQKTLLYWLTGPPTQVAGPFFAPNTPYAKFLLTRAGRICTRYFPKIKRPGRASPDRSLIHMLDFRLLARPATDREKGPAHLTFKKFYVII